MKKKQIDFLNGFVAKIKETSTKSGFKEAFPINVIMPKISEFILREDTNMSISKEENPICVRIPGDKKHEQFNISFPGILEIANLCREVEWPISFSFTDFANSPSMIIEFLSQVSLYKFNNTYEIYNTLVFANNINEETLQPFMKKYFLEYIKNNSSKLEKCKFSSLNLNYQGYVELFKSILLYLSRSMTDKDDSFELELSFKDNTLLKSFIYFSDVENKDNLASNIINWTQKESPSLRSKWFREDLFAAIFE